MAAGQVQAGGLSEAIYKVLVEREKVDPAKIRILGYSDPLPNYPMTLQGYLAPELKQEIRTAFLELDDPEIIKLFRVEKLAPTDDSAYDVLREMADILELDLGA